MTPRNMNMVPLVFPGEMIEEEKKDSFRLRNYQPNPYLQDDPRQSNANNAQKKLNQIEQIKS